VTSRASGYACEITAATDGRRLLGTYLNDHRAGAAGGASLAHRIADAAANTTRGPELAALARQIDEDREFLDRLIADSGFRQSQLKTSLGWVGERVGRLKTNGGLFGRSPLSPVLELEALLAGVEAKRSLWATLLENPVGGATADELQQHLERAESQRQRLEEQHRQAASAAPL